MKPTEYLAAFQEVHRRPVAYHPVYAKLLGDALSGVVLSQVLYWWSAMKGRSFYKTDADFRDELGCSERELRTAKAKMVAAGVVKLKRKGVPAKTWYEVDADRLMALLSSYNETSEQDMTERQNNNAGNTETSYDETSQLITESTAEKLPTNVDQRAGEDSGAKPSSDNVTSASGPRDVLRAALDKLLDSGDTLKALAPKNQARLVLGFYDRVATHKKLTQSGTTKLLETVQAALGKGWDAEEVIHAMWRLQHCTFATDGVQWKSKWDLYYLLERKSQDKVDVALNKYTPDIVSTEEQWAAVLPFQKVLSTPLTRYVAPKQQDVGSRMAKARTLA